MSGEIVTICNGLIKMYSRPHAYSRFSWEEVHKVKARIQAISDGESRDFSDVVDVLLSSAASIFMLSESLCLRINAPNQRQDDPSMTAKLMQLYRNEAKRQAEVALEIVRATLRTPGLFTEDSGEPGITKASLDALSTTLDSELRKIDNNEATIAVIGTVKSGKSTTINAIVGSEVVPSRDQPMTTFPTRVVHTPDRRVPELSFPLASGFSKLARTLREEIRTRKEKDTDGFDALIDAETQKADLLALIADIADDKLGNLPESVEGHENIRALLVTINDLTRLAAKLDVPVDDVTPTNLAYDQTPTISVEFQHLAASTSPFAGTLVLVDTPGPDEAGQFDRLRPVVEQQLRDATAIILTVNYTQFGSRATSDLRELLSPIPTARSNRLFAFINHYDQRGTASLSPDEARHSLASQLHHQFDVDPEAIAERIYMTSARFALRGNQARRAVRHGLSLNPKDDWVQDFANFGFGFGWEDDLDLLNDPAMITQKGDALWRKSGFQAPLDGVIAESAGNAGRMAVLSCVEKIEGNCQPLFDMFNIREGAFSHTIEELSGLVREFEDDLALLERSRDVSWDAITKLAPALSSIINVYFSAAIKDAEETVLEYLSTGNPEADQRTRRASRSVVIHDAIASVLKSFGNIRPQKQKGGSRTKPSLKANEMLRSAPKFATRTGSCGRREIVYSSESLALAEAQKLRTAIKDAFSAAVAEAIETTNDTLRAACDEAQHQVVSAFDQAWKRVEDRVLDALAVELTPPRLNQTEIALSDEKSVDEFLDYKSQTWSEQRPRSGGLEGIKRGLGGLLSKLGFASEDWGYDYIEKSRAEYIIMVDDIVESFKTSYSSLSDDLVQITEDAVENLRTDANKYMRAIEDRIAGINAALLQERVGRETAVSEQSQLRGAVKELASQARDLVRDAMAIKAAVAARGSQ